MTKDSSMCNHRSIETKDSDITHKELVDVVRKHFEKKGYRVHNGLQFGCELVLYADNPDNVHSDFCVHIVRQEGRLDWRTIQTLVRSMPDLHKTLILANVVTRTACLESKSNDNGFKHSIQFDVKELAISSGHAPFRHKKHNAEMVVGSQVKKKRMA